MKRLIRYAVLPLFVALIPFSFAVGMAEQADRSQSFSEELYRKNLTYLASDAQEGRGTGQEGNNRAAEYIAAEFARCGVKPAGDNGTFFQNFTLNLKNKIGSGTRVAIRVGDRRTYRNLRLNKDYVPFPFSGSDEFNGEIVFAGYGILDEEGDYNDYANIDVTDKIVLVLRRAPQFRAFSDRLQSFRAKASRANARDAAAILVVNRDDQDDPALYGFENQDTAAGGQSRSYGIPMLHLTAAAANRLLEAAGKPTIQELQKQIDHDKRPHSMVLKGVALKGRVEIEPTKSPVRNVVGLIPGKGPNADEIIVLGAHYDHLGIRKKGEPDFDSKKDIYNGADDNASGSALVMSMADVYGHGTPPNRSILLMTFTGEEMGLLGSMHFAANPTIDLKNCVAMLNFDMVGRLKDNKLEVGGMKTGDFEKLVQEKAKRFDLEIKDGGGGRGPSDHTSFYNKNIPVLFFFTGIHKQYHQPEDDIPLINFDGAIRIAGLASTIIDEIDSRPKPPKFASDNRTPMLARQKDKQDEKKEPETATARKPRGVRLGIVPETDNKPGVLIAVVGEGTAAEKAGLKVGDRIVRVGRERISDIDDATDALNKLSPGDNVDMLLDRGGKEKRLRVHFDGEKEPAVAKKSDDPFEGIQANITAAANKYAHADGKAELKVSVRPSGDGFEIGVGLGADEDWKSVLADLSKIATDVVSSADGHMKDKVKLSVSASWSPSDAVEIMVKVERAQDAPKKSAAAQGDPHAENPHKPPAKNSHGDVKDDDDETAVEMPRVRLGIMPTYGEAEGEGYPITGVIEGGAAAKAGMKDSDRIYTIGKSKVTNVYEYMDALRKYKPGETIPVTIIRDGKKIALKVVAEAPKSKEAA